MSSFKIFKLNFFILFLTIKNQQSVHIHSAQPQPYYPQPYVDKKKDDFLPLLLLALLPLLLLPLLFCEYFVVFVYIRKFDSNSRFIHLAFFTQVLALLAMMQNVCYENQMIYQMTLIFNLVFFHLN